MSSLPDPHRPPQQAPAWLPALCALALLGGCTTVPPAPGPAPAPAPAPVLAPPAPAPAPKPAPAPAEPRPADLADASTRRLLAAHERLREPGAAEQLREAARQAEPSEPEARIELALALAQTRQNGDLARAVALLEPLARQATGAPYNGFARLLHARLAEQRKLEEANERQAQQLREQQRRLDQLASQIDALRAIERSLSTRPQPQPQPPAAAPR